MRASQLLLVILFVPMAACRQAAETPYAGLEARAIKALAPTDVDAYLNGDGMGYALAAELNHYPGPKHVLELADQIGLSETQVEETRLIFRAMADSAQRLGRDIVDLERQLDEFFASGGSDPAVLSQLVTRISALEGALRFRHLAAHLSMRRLLSPEQIAEYDRRRGYDGVEREGGGGDHQHSDGNHSAAH